MHIYEVKIYYKGKFSESMGPVSRKLAEDDFFWVMDSLDKDSETRSFEESITKGSYKIPLIGVRGPYRVKMVYVGDY